MNQLLAFHEWDWKEKAVHQTARCNKTTGGYIRIKIYPFVILFQLGVSSL